MDCNVYQPAGTEDFVYSVMELIHGFVFGSLRLVGLKNIFGRQLPNMPKEYIVRLVMDR